MKFFHVYNEELFKGLEKNGLLNKDSGFKIQNVFSVPRHLLFNNIAAKGGKLYNLIREGNIPFYVDRIAGGITYFPYAYDKALLREYSEMLGDWFLGAQLHESASNRRQSDWVTLRKRGGGNGPYDPEELRKVMDRPSSVTPEGKVLQALSQDHTDVYAKMRYAETYQEYMDEMRDMFQRRMDDVDGHILPVDSYYMATKIQDELGMKTFMPEVGSQIPLMRLQVAMARGMAKASKKTWGTYYECWHRTPSSPSGVSMPCFHVDVINEWYLTQETHTDDFTTFGKNGGSSRLLQDRIYYYSLMTGADCMAEEWGTNCSYEDMQDFTLSEYGLVKKKFIDTALQLQNVKAVIPFAIVLPKKYSCVCIREISNYPLGSNGTTYMEAPLSEEDQAYFGHLRDVLRLFYCRNGKIYGNESHVLTNTRFGEVADIIYEDASDETLRQYAYLIDATPDSSFAKAKAGSDLKILESANLEVLESNMHKLIPQAMPCYVDGLCWVVSTDGSGKRYLSIFNNEGNMRTVEHGDTLDPEADRVVTVTFKEAAELKVVKESLMVKGVEIQKVDTNTYKVKVPAAAFVIFEY